MSAVEPLFKHSKIHPTSAKTVIFEFIEVLYR